MSLNNIDFSQFLDGFYKLFMQLEPFDGVSSVVSMQKKNRQRRVSNALNLKDLTKVICYVDIHD